MISVGGDFAGQSIPDPVTSAAPLRFVWFVGSPGNPPARGTAAPLNCLNDELLPTSRLVPADRAAHLPHVRRTPSPFSCNGTASPARQKSETPTYPAK
jgi:hypothetical protein